MQDDGAPDDCGARDGGTQGGADHGGETHGGDAHVSETHVSETHVSEAHDSDDDGSEARGGETHGLDAYGGAHGGDPHLWLEPERAQAWLGAIADRLAALGPDAAPACRADADADAAAAEIVRVADAVRDRIAAARSGSMLAVHDAWSRAEAAPGLPIAGALSDHDARAPGAGHLRRIEARSADGDIVCILAARGDGRRQAGRPAAAHPLRTVKVSLIGDPAARDVAICTDLLQSIAGAVETRAAR